MQVQGPFFKYQSLGNDFVIFDWMQKQPQEIRQVLADHEWQAFIKKLCDRHYGVGADGVLVIGHCDEAGVPEVLIFNADGSNGQNCLNGLRCVAQHLFERHSFPRQFRVKMATRLIECAVEVTDSSAVIKTNVGQIVYQGTQAISISAGDFTGYCVDIGNPHFIIFAPQTITWLQEHGALIESHAVFPNRTNVEFVAPAGDNCYNVTVYERGCGVTLACSSGAAAIIGLLANLGHVQVDQHVALCMPGGTVSGFVDKNGNVILMAGAQYVFSGAI